MKPRIKLLLLVGAILTAFCPASATQVGSNAGGSNFNWYDLDGCDRGSYGILKNYHQSGVRNTVKNQLQTMYNNGQRRLRIGVYFSSDLSSGAIIKLSGNDLPAQQRTNLANFLADIKGKGFANVIVGFFPQGASNPADWTAWNETQYQKNWNLIVNLRPLVAGSGLAYKLDLMNEGTPPPSKTVLRDYCKKLWNNYTNKHGKSDTVGFSCIGNPGDKRVSMIPTIYNNDYPPQFDFHFYDDEENKFTQINSQMKAIGLGGATWIIGESFYNDATAASRFVNAKNATGQKVAYQLQWPITRARNCSDVDVASPTAFANYK